MKYFSPLFIFIAGWLVLMFSNTFADIGLINAVIQVVFFAFVVCLPTWRTGRMSYVDIGWPWGLTLIGLLTWCYHAMQSNVSIANLLAGEGHSIRVAVVCIAYIFAGSRMGLGAIKLLKMGHLDRELPRYEYQKRRWQRDGKSNVPLAMQVEAILQGFANASFLAIPAFIIAINPSDSISIFEIIGIIVWLGAFVMETVADMQKLAFLRAMKKQGKRNQVCNVGLWRFTRHPNYFAEWMVWNGLIIAAIPSWLLLYQQEHIIMAILLGLGLLAASRMMYTTLVYYTGAVPSEFYSVQKRPEYKQYQQTTNIFFPGPVKTAQQTDNA